MIGMVGYIIKILILRERLNLTIITNYPVVEVHIFDLCRFILLYN